MLEYYSTPGVRKTCHMIKSSTEEAKKAIQIMANYLIGLNVVNDTSVLVPAPQHIGYATYTLEIAKAISKSTGAKVCDILKRRPEETLYKAKKNRSYNIPSLYKTGDIFEKDIFFVDNVIATGATYYTACKTLQRNMRPLVYAIDTIAWNQNH